MMDLRALFTGMTVGASTLLMVWYYEMQVYFGVKVAVVATLFLYLIVPLLYHLCPSVQRHLVFLPFVRWPTGVNFSDPESEGLVGGRNLYLNSDPRSCVGVWHFLPQCELEKAKGKPESYWDESMRNSGQDIILYLHGNSGSRAGEHRKELYILLQKENFHVVAFDYRGYADSTQIPPNETTTVADGIFVYNWIRDILGPKSNTNVFVWGHSLGTGVSSHMVARLCLSGEAPTALILESPFTSIAEEVKHHMLAALWRYMPAFEWIFTSPLKKNDLAFESDKHIAFIHIPILILHAVDDPVVPFHLGRKLYQAALDTRGNTSKPVYFRRFGEGYAHKYICRSPELPGFVNEFVRCSVNDDWPCEVLQNSESETED